MTIQLPRELFGWHGHGEATILTQDGTNITLDLSGWCDEKGYGISGGGHEVKKKFTKHILIFLGLHWDKENRVCVCDDMVLGKGMVQGNKLHGTLFSNNLFLMKEVHICFPHKSKHERRGNMLNLVPEEYDEEELKTIIANLKGIVHESA